MPTLTIKNWFGGVSDDPRNETYIAGEMVEHFDIFDSTKKMIPLRSSVSADDSDKKINKFLYSSNGSFYGLGVNSGKISIYELSSVPSGTTWNAVTNGVSSANGISLGGFVEYKGDIFGIWSNNKVFRWEDFDGSPTFTDSFGTLSTSASYVADSIIGADDELYMFYNNYVAQIDSSKTFTANKFILPERYTIRSVTTKGDYMYIAASSNGVTETSKIFIWDYINADPIDIIDLGLPIVHVVANVDGTIITISLTEPTSITFEQKLIVKQWIQGDTATTFKSIPLGTNGFNCLKESFVDDNRLFFGLNRNSDSDPQFKGVWCLGRKNNNYSWGICRYHKPDNDTTINNLNSFYKLGDYFFVSHGTTGEIDKTDSSESYNVTSSFISEIFASENKRALEAISLTTEPIPASGSISVDYRVDEEIAWTTILTNNTANSTYIDATRENGDSIFSTNYVQKQFRIRSTGGVVPVTLKAKFRNLSSKLD